MVPVSRDFSAEGRTRASALRQALDTARVIPADQLPRNEKYRRALAKYPGLQINPIRAAVEQYAARYDNGSKRLLELLSKELQEHVAERLHSLALGEPLTHLNVAHVYEAVKKWSATDQTSNRPGFDAFSIRRASEAIHNRRTARTT